MFKSVPSVSKLCFQFRFPEKFFRSRVALGSKTHSRRRLRRSERVSGIIADPVAVPHEASYQKAESVLLIGIKIGAQPKVMAIPAIWVVISLEVGSIADNSSELTIIIGVLMEITMAYKRAEFPLPVVKGDGGA